MARAVAGEEPVPEEPLSDIMHPESAIAASVAAARWPNRAVAAERRPKARYDRDSQYNAKHNLEQMQGEGELSMLLHHKLTGEAHLDSSLVEYFGTDDDRHTAFSTGEQRALPWEAQLRRKAEYASELAADRLPPRPNVNTPTNHTLGPTRSPALHSSAVFAHDSHGTFLLDDGEEPAPGTPSKDVSASRRRLEDGDVSTRTAARRKPRPSPSPRSVPRLATTSPRADSARALQDAAHMLGAARLGFDGMLDDTPVLEGGGGDSDEALALIPASPRGTAEGGTLRRYQAPPPMRHVRQPQPRTIDFNDVGYNGPGHSARTARERMPRRHLPMRAAAQPRSLAIAPSAPFSPVESMLQDYTNVHTSSFQATLEGGALEKGFVHHDSLFGKVGEAEGPDGGGEESAELLQLRRKLQGLSYGQHGQDPKKLFEHFDRDNSGQLDEEEFHNAVRKGGNLTAAMLSDAAISKLFRAIDVSAPAVPFQPGCESQVSAGGWQWRCGH